MDDTELNKRMKDILRNTGDMALKRRAINIIEGLDLKEGDKILDVGCGDGYYLHLLSNLDLKLDLTGTDYSEHDLERARINLTNKKIRLVYGDLMRKLPFLDSSFDKVVMSEVAEHLPNDVKGLREVYRVLKPGGILALTVPNHNYPFLWDPMNWVLEKISGRHVKNGFFGGIWNQHIRLYTKEEITKVVKMSGFTIQEAKPLTFWCLPFNHYIVNLVARGLAAGCFGKSTSASLSKYSKDPKRHFLLTFAFWMVNKIDKLNDLFPEKCNGVSVFIKAKKL